MTLRNRLASGIVCAGLALGMGLSLTACSDSTSESITPTDPVNPSGNPTTDQLGVTYTGKALVLGDNRSGMDGAVAARVKNPAATASADLQAVIFLKGANYNFDMATVKLMAQAYGNNATIVVTAPEELVQSSFADSLKKFASELNEEGEIDEADVVNDFVERIVKLRPRTSKAAMDEGGLNAFRLQAAYASSSVSADMNSGSSESLVVGTNGDSTTVKLPVQTNEPTAYNYGVSADNLFSWMIEGDKTDGGNGVTGLVTYSTTKTMTPSTVFGEVMDYKTEYKVFPVYDFVNDEDIYLVQVSPTFYSSKLQSAPGLKKWNTNTIDLGNGKTISPTSKTSGGELVNAWEGPYFVGYKYDVLGVEGVEAEFSDASPEHIIDTSKPYTMSVTLKADSTRGTTCAMDTLGKAFSENYSVSYEYPANTAIMLGHYTAANGLDWLVNANIGNSVNTPLYSDWTPTMAWIVRIKHPEIGKQYRLNTHMETTVDERCASENASLYTYDTCSVAIDLPQPIRVHDAYKMEILEYDETDFDEQAWIIRTDNALKQYYPPYISLQRNFYTYDYTKEKCDTRAIAAFRKYVTQFNRRVQNKDGGSRMFKLVLKDGEGNPVLYCRMVGPSVSYRKTAEI